MQQLFELSTIVKFKKRIVLAETVSENTVICHHALWNLSTIISGSILAKGAFTYAVKCCLGIFDLTKGGLKSEGAG